MNLINLESNYNPEWFFTIAVDDELREIDHITIFLLNQEKLEMEILIFYAILFEPIMVQKRSAPQNDSLNLSFVKGVAKQWSKMVVKWQFMSSKFPVFIFQN